MIRSFKNTAPQIPDSCYIFPNATVIGNVIFGKNIIAYPGCVIRAEYGKISIGSYTNLQENTSIHVEVGYDVTIGEGVTIGHNCIIHGCTIHDNVLIGMGAIIQEGADIGENCFIGAGAVIKRNMVIPSGSVVYGVPARIIRPIAQAEFDEIRVTIAEYQSYLQEFKRQDAEKGTNY